MIHSDGQYRVWIQVDHALMDVGLHVTEVLGGGTHRILGSTGQWSEPIQSGVAVADTPIRLPDGPVLALVAKAMAEHTGGNLPSGSEVRVLREWLSAEQGRVDRLVERGLNA